MLCIGANICVLHHSLFFTSSTLNYLSRDYMQITTKYHSGKRVKYLELIVNCDLNAYFLYLSLS
jgi:hypothetical protein